MFSRVNRSCRNRRYISREPETIGIDRYKYRRIIEVTVNKINAFQLFETEN